MRYFTLLMLSLLTACSPSTGDGGSNDRYQFVGGSKDSIDIVFDRATGCIAEIKREPSVAEFMAGDPVFDPSKPFTVSAEKELAAAEAKRVVTVPDWAKDDNAVGVPEKPKPVGDAKDGGSFDFHGSVESFEPWRCPTAARAEATGVKK